MFISHLIPSFRGWRLPSSCGFVLFAVSCRLAKVLKSLLWFARSRRTAIERDLELSVVLLGCISICHHFDASTCLTDHPHAMSSPVVLWRKLFWNKAFPLLHVCFCFHYSDISCRYEGRTRWLHCWPLPVQVIQMRGSCMNSKASGCSKSGKMFGLTRNMWVVKVVQCMIWFSHRECAKCQRMLRGFSRECCYLRLCFSFRWKAQLTFITSQWFGLTHIMSFVSAIKSNLCFP